MDRVTEPTREAGARVHELKTWRSFFEDLLSGAKCFELRINDRGFMSGDVLHLRETEEGGEPYTGRELWADVTYVLQGTQWLQPGVVCMGLKIRRQATAPPPPAVAELVGRLFELADMLALYKGEGGPIGDAAAALEALARERGAWSVAHGSDVASAVTAALAAAKAKEGGRG
jgi:hypothetical protein